MHSQASEPAAILQLWGLQGPARRGPRPTLTLGQITSAATILADDKGLDAVTLAAVAARLGLATTGLYRYVDSKETLLELVVDHALGDPPRLRGRTVASRTLAWVGALWGRYELHPWLASLAPTRPPRSPNALAWMELLVDDLTRAAHPDPLGTALALDILVRGYALVADIAMREPGMSEALTTEIARRCPALAAAGTSRSGGALGELEAVTLRLITR